MSEQMTESPFEAEPAGASPRRRALVIGGIATVVAALGAGAYILLGGSNSGDPVADGSAPGRTQSAAAHASATPSASASSAAIAVTAPRASAQPNRHDPFRPLFPPKVIPTTAPPVTAAPTPTNGLPGAPGGTVGPGGTPGVPGAPGAHNVVKLVSISGAGATPTVTVAIDGIPTTGKTGEVLGGVLQVVSIRADDGAATFQLGESTFDLHTGQSYTN